MRRSRSTRFGLAGGMDVLVRSNRNIKLLYNFAGSLHDEQARKNEKADKNQAANTIASITPL